MLKNQEEKALGEYRRRRALETWERVWICATDVAEKGDSDSAMPKKKSNQKSVEDFKRSTQQIRTFIDEAVRKRLSDQSITLVYELAIIKLYTAFERLVLNCIVGAINNDTSVLAKTTGVQFPKHLTDEVCEFLVVGTGYFDFKGRDGLIKQLKDSVPADHYLVKVVSETRFKDSLNRLCALRNFAAHESAVSKSRARQSVDCNLGSAGTWLKRQDRYQEIADRLSDLADAVYASAPY